MASSRRLRALALAAATSLVPGAARPSGAVPAGISLEKVLERSQLVVVGVSLDRRTTRARFEAADLAPGAVAKGQGGLDVDVVELGVRVEEVLLRRGDATVARGTELWAVDPVAYHRGRMGRLAQVAWVVETKYRPARRDADGKGRRVVLYLERGSALGGRQGGGFDERWFLVVGDAFDPASMRARVKALAPAPRRGGQAGRRAGRAGRPPCPLRPPVSRAYLTAP